MVDGEQMSIAMGHTYWILIQRLLSVGYLGDPISVEETHMVQPEIRVLVYWSGSLPGDQ